MIVMKKLYLIRHAKTSPPGYFDSDLERPLSETGIKQSEELGRTLKKYKITPELILCSNATRTTQTLSIVKEICNWATEIRYSQSLYLCGWAKLLDELFFIPEETKSVMIIGHSPDLHGLASALTADPVFYTQFPTGSFVEINIVSNWLTCNYQHHELVRFIKPEP